MRSDRKEGIVEALYCKVLFEIHYHLDTQYRTMTLTILPNK